MTIITNVNNVQTVAKNDITEKKAAVPEKNCQVNTSSFSNDINTSTCIIKGTVPANSVKLADKKITTGKYVENKAADEISLGIIGVGFASGVVVAIKTGNGLALILGGGAGLITAASTNSIINEKVHIDENTKLGKSAKVALDVLSVTTITSFAGMALAFFPYDKTPGIINNVGCKMSTVGAIGTGIAVAGLATIGGIALYNKLHEKN